MSNGHALYRNSEGAELHFFIDVDLKTEKIQDFKTKGSLSAQYESEFEELEKLIINHTIKDALSLKRSSLQNEVRLKNGNLPLSSSLSLWLLNSAIEDYLGSASSLSEQNDLLCLCYGIGERELKKQILARSDYDLPALVAETMATSACGSCRLYIQQKILNIREEHGLILGLDHSQSRLDSVGHWIKIKSLYPSDLLIKLDELKKIWMKREEISEQFEIDIVRIEGYHLWLSVLPEDDSERSKKILVSLSEYWHSEMGALFFIHLYGE